MTFTVLLAGLVNAVTSENAVTTGGNGGGDDTADDGTAGHDRRVGRRISVPTAAGRQWPELNAGARQVRWRRGRAARGAED